MDDCIFCKILKGEIPSTKVYEDDEMLIFKDIAPIAKIHLLCIPKVHFPRIHDMDEEKARLVSRMLLRIGSLESELGLERGYRLVINQGESAGQTVPHLHIHILGGETLPWP